jgi:hypothetical protein
MTMHPISRRNVLTAVAAGGMITAATAADGETIPQPRRPGVGAPI